VARETRLHPNAPEAVLINCTRTVPHAQSNPDIEIIAPLLVSSHVFGDVTIRSVSGREGIDKRKRFNELFGDAIMRKFDLVLFQARPLYPRGHGAGHQLLAAPQWLRLGTDNLVRNILLAVRSTLAKVEAEKISAFSGPLPMARSLAAGGSTLRSSARPARCSRTEWVCSGLRTSSILVREPCSGLRARCAQGEEGRREVLLGQETAKG
jgi:hypothetical protein